jgi:hypothetical protein
MVMMRILSSLIICLLLVTQVYAVDICLFEEQAKQVIVATGSALPAIGVVFSYV